MYEELHRRYGSHISQRLRRELTVSEFDALVLDDLAEWLEIRAETAHDHYRALLSNPLVASESNYQRTGEACRRWREAEDLSYLIALAEDVGATVRAV